VNSKRITLPDISQVVAEKLFKFSEKDAVRKKGQKPKTTFHFATMEKVEVLGRGRRACRRRMLA